MDSEIDKKMKDIFQSLQNIHTHSGTPEWIKKEIEHLVPNIFDVYTELIAKMIQDMQILNDRLAKQTMTGYVDDEYKN